MCFFLIYYCIIVFMYIDYVTLIYCICSSQVSCQLSHPQNRTAAAQTPKAADRKAPTQRPARELQASSLDRRSK